MDVRRRPFKNKGGSNDIPTDENLEQNANQLQEFNKDATDEEQKIMEEFQRKYGKDYNTADHHSAISKQLEDARSKERVDGRGEDPPLSYTLKQYAFGFLVFATAFAIVYFFHYHTLPKAVSVNSADFSEARARTYVHEMSSQIGKRLVGSDGTTKTITFLLRELNLLKSYLDEKRKGPYGDAVPTLEIDVQNGTGAHIFHFLNAVITNAYSNISNVIGRLSFGEESKKHSLLVNAHFDSAIGSVGASDDAASVAVMLDILNVLAKSHTLKNSVIFLFNGAEESLQQGSHTFITTHPWGHGCRLVVNLEACGAGGPEVLFQSGSAEIVKMFAQYAKRPHGTSFANDIFATGIIQSDTDYRIFKQYKGVVGLDLAFYRNSFLYHTTHDTLENIDEGSLQHMGENALYAIIGIANSTLLEDDSHLQESHVVYFDVLRLFMVVYSSSFAKWMHTGFFAAFLVLALRNDFYMKVKSIYRMSFSPILASLWSIVLSYAAAFVTAVLTAIFVSKGLGRPLPYYSIPIIVIPFYGLPVLTAMIAVQYIFFQTTKKLKNNPFEWTSLIALTIFHSIFMLLLTWLNKGTSLIFFSWFASLCLMIWILYFREDRTSQSVEVLGVLYAAAHLVPAIINWEICIGVMDLFVPLAGRLGYSVPGDVVLAIIVTFFITNIGSMIIPFFHRGGNLKRVVQVFAAISVVFVLVVSFHFPFDKLHPKRLYIQHTVTYNPVFTRDSPIVPVRDQIDKSFILLSTSDQISLSGSYLQIPKEFQFTTLPDKDVELMYWDSVYPFSYMLQGSGIKIDAELPKVIAPPGLEVVSDTYDAAADLRTLKLNFHYAGNEWCTMRFYGPLLRWSLTDELPPSFDNAYLVRHVGGFGITQWPIELVFKGNQQIYFNCTASHFVPTSSTQSLMNFLPEWVDALVAFTTITNWKI